MRRRRHAMITPQAAPSAAGVLEGWPDARRVELALLDDLTDAQMLGTRAHFVEPPIWEMGHVGWFQEYWLLRRLDGADPLLSGADDIYDSFNVSYTRRWDHRFPSRASTRAYIAEVLRRSVARLESREPRGDDAYFYTLAALHEDMHGENLTAILQTLGYARPASLGSTPAPAPPVDPGFRPRDVSVPGGAFTLGAEPDEPFVFDNEKWAHPVEVEPFRIAAKPARANLDYRAGGTLDVCALPAGDSPVGCRQMIGNVWEWVADTFQPYPGFVCDPYKEYSEPHFGQKNVLKGGCWTTRSRLIRGTWRNFFKRQRRNVFAGFRTVAR